MLSHDAKFSQENVAVYDINDYDPSREYLFRYDILDQKISTSRGNPLAHFTQ